MKIVRYILTSDGKIPNQIIDGGYFPKKNDNNSPQDYDLIGLSNTWNGLEEFTTKSQFENYIKSFCFDFVVPDKDEITYIQDEIDKFWSRK